jgi:uncharacterized protein
VITGFFKLIFYLLISYLIYLFVRLVFAGPRRSQTRRPPQKISGTMVKDEFCNTYIPREEAIREQLDGKDYFFCSQECRRKFLDQKKGRS